MLATKRQLMRMLLSFSFATCMSLAEVDALALSGGAETVLYVRYGDGAGDVLYQTKSKEGPRVVFDVPNAVNSFWVGDDETIYLLEGGSTIKSYKNGKYIKSLGIGGYTEDFALTNDRILVVASNDLKEFSLSAHLLKERRVYGAIEANETVKKVTSFKDKIVLVNESYIFPPGSAVKYLYVCLNISTFEKIDCGIYDFFAKRGQVLDSDSSSYVWVDSSSGTLKVASEDDTNIFDTGFDIVNMANRIDFNYNSIVRIRGGYVYILFPEKNGIRITRLKWRSHK